jgi:uncharacterized protein
MKAAELHAPLSASERKQIKLELGLVPSLLASALLLAPFAVWILIVDDPLAGEPRAVARLAPVQERRAEEPVAARQPAPAAPTAAVRPTVQIMSPGPDGRMTVRRVEVPADNAPESSPSSQPQALAPTSPAARVPLPNQAPIAQRRPEREVPDPDLIDKIGNGLLPRIGPDGTRPWRAYGRPPGTVQPGHGRVALVITGIGLSNSATEATFNRLPPEVSVAISPYSSQPQSVFERARASGREALLQIPMEPFDFPSSDPGPQSLLVGTSAQQNIERLRWSMARFAGYLGVVPMMGSRFTSAPEALRPVIEELRARGLAIVDDGASVRSQISETARGVGAAFARANAVIDASPTPDRIDEALAALETRAREQGSAIGFASALPISLERITRWRRDLERRGVTLVPVSSLITADR